MDGSGPARAWGPSGPMTPKRATTLLLSRRVGREVHPGGVAAGLLGARLLRGHGHDRSSGGAARQERHVNRVERGARGNIRKRLGGRLSDAGAPGKTTVRAAKKDNGMCAPGLPVPGSCIFAGRVGPNHRLRIAETAVQRRTARRILLAKLPSLPHCRLVYIIRRFVLLAPKTVRLRYRLARQHLSAHVRSLDPGRGQARPRGTGVRETPGRTFVVPPYGALSRPHRRGRGYQQPKQPADLWAGRRS